MSIALLIAILIGIWLGVITDEPEQGDPPHLFYRPNEITPWEREELRVRHRSSAKHRRLVQAQRGKARSSSE